MEENKKPENPSAFPLPTDAGYDDRRGMTLRDYFATAAMQGLLGNSTFKASLPKESEHISALVYEIADAMLKQREL